MSPPLPVCPPPGNDAARAPPTTTLHFAQAAIHSEAAFGFLWLRGLRRFRPQPAPEHDSVYKQRWHASLQTTDGNAAGMNGAYRGGGA